MGLILHPDAQREYHEAIVFYEEDYPGRGRRFFDAVQAEVERIRQAPHTFPRWRRTDFRCVVVPRFPCQVIFREEPDGVWIYAVAHTKKRAGYWRARVSR